MGGAKLANVVLSTLVNPLAYLYGLFIYIEFFFSSLSFRTLICAYSVIKRRNISILWRSWIWLTVTAARTLVACVRPQSLVKSVYRGAYNHLFTPVSVAMPTVDSPAVKR